MALIGDEIAELRASVGNDMGAIGDEILELAAAAEAAAANTAEGLQKLIDSYAIKLAEMVNEGKNYTQEFIDLQEKMNKAQEKLLAVHREDAKNSYEAQLADLKISLAKEKITQEQYNRESLKLEKQHWQEILKTRKAALKEIADAGKRGSEEYKKALLEVKQAELELVKTEKKLKDAVEDTAKEMGNAGDEGKKGAETAELAWEKLAEVIGISVDTLKQAVAEVSGEVAAAYKSLQQLEQEVSARVWGMTPEEYGDGMSDPVFRSFNSMSKSELEAELQRLQGRRASGVATGDELVAIETINNLLAAFNSGTTDLITRYDVNTAQTEENTTALDANTAEIGRIVRAYEGFNLSGLQTPHFDFPELASARDQTTQPERTIALDLRVEGGQVYQATIPQTPGEAFLREVERAKSLGN